MRFASVTEDAELPEEASSCIVGDVRGARVPLFIQESFSIEFPFEL